MISVDLTKKGYCYNCKFWKQSETNPMIGRCSRIGVLFFPKDIEKGFVIEDNKMQVEVALHAPHYEQSPYSEVLGVRTPDNFGCVAHDPRKE